MLNAKTVAESLQDHNSIRKLNQASKNTDNSKN